MIIRDADIEKDALVIADGARRFAEKMSLGRFISDNFVESISPVVVLENVKILLAEHNGNPVGGIGICLVPYIWNKDLLIGDELFWWVDDGAPFRTAKLLFDKAMEYIEEKGAIPMFKALINSPKGVEKMYRKADMQPMETLFTRIP